MASGGGDDDKIPLQELTSNELNDKGDTLAGDKENVDMKVEEDYKPSSDAISSPSGATNNTAGTTCELVNQEEGEDYWTFPDLAVRKIMKNTLDKQTLLNSRLVSVQWNQIIEDTSELMKKITFYVSDLQEFLDLPIVKKGKIKSIVIRTCSPSELLDRFVDAISNSVEKVTFTLNEEDQLSPVLKLVLEKFVNLCELRFDECFGVGILSKSGVMEETEIAAAMKITILSIDVNGLKLSDAFWLSRCLPKPLGVGSWELLAPKVGSRWLPKLPVLKELELIGDGRRLLYSNVIHTLNCLNEYLKWCDVSSLKKLSLKPIRDQYFSRQSNFQSDSGLGLLFILCGKHGIRIDEMPYVDLKWLLSIDEPLFDSIRYGQSLESKTDGFICVSFNSYLTNLDRLYLLNVEELEIAFCRNLVQCELSWIGNLDGLKVLTLRESRMSRSVHIELDPTFSAGLPSVKVLNIWHDVFDSIRVLRLAQYFPNLNELFIMCSGVTPDNFIVELTVVQSLSKIALHLHSLTDKAFTMECVDRYASSTDSNDDDNDSSVKAPAIVCLKSLKYLCVDGSWRLTDACVINGISKAKTLEKVIIANCTGVSKVACDRLIKCKVRYEESSLVGDLSKVFEF